MPITRAGSSRRPSSSGTISVSSVLPVLVSVLEPVPLEKGDKDGPITSMLIHGVLSRGIVIKKSGKRMLLLLQLLLVKG